MGNKNTSRYIKFALYALVVVLINVVGITLFTRFDLTGNKVYSLSDVSKKVVSTLSEPLTINVFFTSNLPAPYNSVERYLKDLLAEYSLHANNYFNYRFFDVSPEGELGAEENAKNRKLAGDYGIYPVQIQAYEQDEVKFKKAYMGLVIIHGDMMERINTITTTDGLEYKLTSAILKLNNKISALINLKDPVQVHFYMSSSLNKVAPYIQAKDLPDMPERIKHIVEDLGKTMYGKISYSFTDPTDDSEMDALATKYGILQLKWPELKSARIDAGTGVIGLVMEHGDSAVTLPVLNVFKLPLLGTQYQLVGADELKEMITENMESLIGINANMGYLADHGTLERFAMPGAPAQDAISNFSSLVSKNYTLKDVQLEDQGIPEGLGCMIIAGPKQKFSDYDLFQIDQALMRGTNLAIFLDAFEQAQTPSQQQYVPLSTGLEKLLEHYGIRIKKSYVMDESSYKQRLPRQYGGGEQNLYYAPIIKSENINHHLEYMKNIKEFITLMVSPLEIDEQRIKENNLRADRLFSSSDKSWEMKDNINLNPMFMKPPASDDAKSSFPLAYVLEGKFPSYFAGKPIPEKPVKEPDDKTGKKSPEGADLSQIKGTGEVITTSRGAKIFLIASSEMLRNNMIDAEGMSPNAMFVQNVLDVLNNREDMARMRSKVLTFNPLDDTDAATKTFIKAFNIAGLPIVVIIFGLLMWMKRHMRRKHIEMMFQERR